MVASDSKLDSYIHMGGKIGVLVEASANISAEVIHDVALQIAAAKPTCVSKEEVPSGDIEKEKEILRAQALNEGKPVAIVDKMVEGRIHKYYKEVCLLEQDFVKDGSLTVGKVLANDGSSVKNSFVSKWAKASKRKSTTTSTKSATQFPK